MDFEETCEACGTIHTIGCTEQITREESILYCQGCGREFFSRRVAAEYSIISSRKPEKPKKGKKK